MTTIGDRGQVTIPKEIRDRLGLRPGQQVDFREEEGRVVITKSLADDPVARVYGILRLPAPVDELIDEMRGSAEFPPER